MKEFTHFTAWSDIEPVISEYAIPHRGILQIGAFGGYEFNGHFQAGFTYIAAFEPQPQFNMELTQIQVPSGCRLDIFDYGLGDHEGEFPLFIPPPPHFGAASFLKQFEYPRTGSPMTPATTIPCRIKRYDALPEATTINELCNVVVLDAEGMELSIARGMGLFLNNVDFDVIVVEVSMLPRAEDGAPSSLEVIDFMTNRGFIQITDSPSAWAETAAFDMVFLSNRNEWR